MRAAACASGTTTGASTCSDDLLAPPALRFFFALFDAGAGGGAPGTIRIVGTCGEADICCVEVTEAGMGVVRDIIRPDARSLRPRALSYRPRRSVWWPRPQSAKRPVAAILLAPRRNNLDAPSVGSGGPDAGAVFMIYRETHTVKQINRVWCYFKE